MHQLSIHAAFHILCRHHSIWDTCTTRGINVLLIHFTLQEAKMTPNVRSSFIPRSIPRHLPTGNFADTVYVPPPIWCFIPLHFMPSEHHKAKPKQLTSLKYSWWLFSTVIHCLAWLSYDLKELSSKTWLTSDKLYIQIADDGGPFLGREQNFYKLMLVTLE